MTVYRIMVEHDGNAVMPDVYRTGSYREIKIDTCRLQQLRGILYTAAQEYDRNINLFRVIMATGRD